VLEVCKKEERIKMIPLLIPLDFLEEKEKQWLISKLINSYITSPRNREY
jgi:hypothetical protein